MRRLRALLRGIAAAYAPRVINRFPPVRVATGPWVPAGLIRVASAAAATACLAVVSASVSENRGVWSVFVVVAVLLVAWPARLLPSLVALAIGALPVLTGVPLSIAQTAALLVGLPTVALLGALGGQVGLLARVELATLVPVARRLAVIQLVAQPVGLLAAAVRGVPIDLNLLPVVAIAGLAVLVILWVPTLSDPE